MSEDVVTQGFTEIISEVGNHQDAPSEGFSTGGAGVELGGGPDATKLVSLHNLETNEGDEDGFPTELGSLNNLRTLVVKEAIWARRSGIEHSEMARMRRELLIEGEDYEKVGVGRVVWYTEAGLAKLGLKIGLTSDLCPPAAGSSLASDFGSPTSAPMDEIREFVVVKVCRNSRFVECSPTSDFRPLTSGPADLRGRVRDNHNFKPGMVVKARPSREWGDVWDLVGRTPRYKGRW